MEGIPDTEVSEPFVAGMRSRMAVSYYKYGPVAESQGKIDYLACLQQRLDKYAETGNTEYLMDAANFAMIEFMFPRHALAHFKATDSNGSPGRIAANKAIYDKPVMASNRELPDESEQPF